MKYQNMIRQKTKTNIKIQTQLYTYNKNVDVQNWGSGIVSEDSNK